MVDLGDVHARLSRQSLGRSLDPWEVAMADALEAIFRSGCHDFEKVVAELNLRGITRSTGDVGDWTPAALQAELSRINASLDEAYSRRGSVERT